MRGSPDPRHGGKASSPAAEPLPISDETDAAPAAEAFIKAYRENMAPMVAKGLLTEAMVEDAKKERRLCFRLVVSGGIVRRVRHVVPDTARYEPAERTERTTRRWWFPLPRSRRPFGPRPRERRAVFVLDGVTLVPETRKPFDLLAEGLLVRSNRGDRTPIELFLAGIASWEPYVERLLLAA